MGFVPIYKAARQLVSHYHILINGKKSNIPNYLCSVNDAIIIPEKSKKMELIEETIKNNKNTNFPIFKVDDKK